MARIDVLPSIDIIRGFKGILDFYVWRGLPCVRAWPRYRPARQTDASLAAALLFGAVIKAYSQLADTALTAYRDDAADHNRTARDIMVSGVYGRLHEASMSDFLTLLTQCRNFLSNLTALLNALDSIDTDELVVNVDQSVLPPLAATTTIQTTQLTALQKIDDLQDALESIGLDRLLVRGSDQLFSFLSPLYAYYEGVVSGVDGSADVACVDDGTIWNVTTISARDRTNPVTVIDMVLMHGGIGLALHGRTAAIAAWETVPWSGHTTAEHPDIFRVYFTGAQAGDLVDVYLTGFRMTKET